MTQNAKGRTKNKNEIEKEKRRKRGMQNAKVASRISYKVSYKLQSLYGIAWITPV